MKTVLLTEAIGPYGLGWGMDMFDLMGARLTRAQGPFTIRSYLHPFALYTIAENIPAHTIVLDKPGENLFRKVLENDFDFIGIQVITLLVPNIARMIRIIKELSPESKIVLGGYGLLSLHDPLPHDPENYAGYILDNADYECYEEGVAFFRKLLDADPSKPITQNYLPMGGITFPGFEPVFSIPLSSTLLALGCPNACEFCNTSEFYKAKKIRVFSPEQACETLKIIIQKHNDKSEIFNMIWDEDFLIDKDYIMKLSKLLQMENLIGKVNIFCFASIRSISQYTSEELLLAGIGSVWIGVESKFEECITSVHNFQKRAGRDVAEVFLDLHRHGIEITASNLLGLDFHTKENIKEEIDYFVSLKPDLYQVSPLTPCPGTKLYKRMKEEGRLFDHYTWEHFQLWKDDIYEYKNFKKNEIKEYFDECHKKLYETNGPSSLSTMDVALQGYRTLLHSPNPHLQQRADVHYHMLQKIVPFIMYSIKKMAPTQSVLQRASDVENRYKKYIGSYSIFEKIVQRIVYFKIKKMNKLKLKNLYKEKSEPPWRLTHYNGELARPTFILRKKPIKHYIKKRSIDVSNWILRLNRKPLHIIKFNDIDDFPVNFNTMEIEGDVISYVDEGEGDVILLLHGNPSWSYIYRHFIQDLKNNHRCIAPDHLGFGLSDKPPGADYSIEAHIRRLDKFIENLNIENITMICQDWGGIIGLSYASKNKRRFKRLVIMNTTGFVPGTIGEFFKCAGSWAYSYLLLYKIPILGKMMAVNWDLFLKSAFYLGIVNRKRQMHKKAMLGYKYPYQRKRDRFGILKAVREIPIGPWSRVWKLLMKIEQSLNGWDIRTQFIWGMKDPVFLPLFLEKFERILTNHAPSLKIPTAGHMLQDDEPEIIINKIKQFLLEDVKEEKDQVLPGSSKLAK